MFSKLLTEIRKEGNDGKAFEAFCKWFLENDPMWKTQVKKVWLWNEWPGNWGRDKGIDLVFEHSNGQTWAVQAKCYNEDHSITKADVDKFLSESNRSIIDKRLLMGTTNGLGANAIEVMEGQEKPVKRYLLDDFENSAVIYPSSLSKLSGPAAIIAPDRDRDYQQNAVREVIKKFEKYDRGQLIMACGTGKTFVTLWIKEEMKANTTLVLVPSLGLLSQTLFEWTRHCSKEFEVLCVCSDTTVGKEEREEDISISDAAYDVTSDVAEISTFFTKTKDKVVFCTYQSSELIGQAQGANVLDLVICDEAHRCAGQANSRFTAILESDFVKAEKRLFTTATPRVYANNVSAMAKRRGVDLYGMDNEAKFGPVFFHYTFGQAIQEGWLSDYQVVVVGVDEPLVEEYIDTQELVKLDRVISTDAASLASKIALAKATSDFDLKRVISFHNRVKAAKDFAREYLDIFNSMDPSRRPKFSLNTDYVSGAMSARIRRQKLRTLKHSTGSNICLLANARCLSEGIDIPSLDGVAFIEPKSSQVDIIQSLGRALRLSDKKKKGTIILPVFVGSNVIAESAIETSDFKAIWDVIRALRSHDETLAEELDGCRTQMGRRKFSKRGSGKKSKLPAKIILDIPVTIDVSFQDALSTRLVESTTNDWQFNFGLLQQYETIYGNAGPNQRYETETGVRLGSWVATQRTNYNHGSILPERIGLLESLESWVWDPIEANWREGFEALKEFSYENGHARPPRGHPDQNSFDLGAWVGQQRSYYLENKVPAERISLLEALPRWSWDLNASLWQDGYEALIEACKDLNVVNIQREYKTKDGYPIGGWVINQRSKYKKKLLNSEQIDLLESVNGWVWDLNEAHWDFAYQKVLNYLDDYGNVSVKRGYETTDGFKLASWVSNQRGSYKKSTLDKEKVKRLESLPGWNWDVHSEKWEAAYELLVAHAGEYKTSRVQAKYKTSKGFSLGSWVDKQRRDYNASKLYPTQIFRLENLPHWTWLIEGEQIWEDHLADLRAYSELNGTCRVSQDQRFSDGTLINSWLSNQRKLYRDRKLSGDKIKKLEKLQGWAWDVSEHKWQLGYQKLADHVRATGSSVVTAKYETEDGFKLAQWISVNRKIYRDGNLPAKKVRMLEQLTDWSWAPDADRWERSLGEYLEYVKINKDPQPLQGTVTNTGFNVGTWVNTLRLSYRDGKLEDHKIRALEVIEGWSWNPLVDAKNQGYDALLVYLGSGNKLPVPTGYISPDGYTLGRWVSEKRNEKPVDKDLRLKLEKIPGWIWGNVRDVAWQKGFDELCTYVKDNDEKYISSSLITKNGYKLGAWVLRQRNNKETLVEERKKALEETPGWTWNSLETNWERHFDALIKYQESGNHMPPPVNYISEDNIKLGAWAGRQRTLYQGSKLEPERADKLAAIKGWVWHIVDARWDVAIAELRKYQSDGNAMPPPHNCVTSSGFELGTWTTNRMREYKYFKLRSDILQELEKIPGWVWQRTVKSARAGD